jgi:SAM-dependent methyltransferase
VTIQSKVSDARISSLLSLRFARDAGAAVRLTSEQRTITQVLAGKLTDGSYKMLSDSCPCCGNVESDITLASIDRYGLPMNTVLCSICGTLRTNPYPDDASLADFYTYYYQQMYARSKDRLAYSLRQQAYGRRVLDAVQGWLLPGGFVFEVGCGAGGALEVIRQAGYEVSGCDYSRELVDYGCCRGLSLHRGSALDVLKELPSPALIFMHHVFEHVREPLAFLDSLRNRLAPGGKVLVIVPDVSRIGRFPFPAGDLRLFLHIAHRFNFSIPGFRILARRAGFVVESIQQREASQSPELWVVLTIRQFKESKCKEIVSGQEMLAYLRRTERLRGLYLTRGQMLLLLQRIRGKIRRIVGHFKTP